MIKRTLDMLAALTGMILLAPLLAAIGLLVRLTSPGPALFRQERIGRDFRPFMLYKFRSMVADAPRLGAQITFGDDPRVTRLGRLLRKTKLDELPQLFNVLRGDMSLVGPRPEVRRYVEMFRDDYVEILRARPGITDLASLEFRREAELLGAAADPEEEYVRRVLPEKIRLAKQYVRQASVRLDLWIIVKTVALVAADRLPLRAGRRNSSRTENTPSF